MVAFCRVIGMYFKRLYELREDNDFSKKTIAEYLHIDEAQMRERFAGAIEAIGQFKQTNQSTKEAEP